MQKRLVQLLVLATALFGTGAAIVLIANGISPRPGRVDMAALPVRAHATLLPTVVVRPPAVIPTLPTVTVRADAHARTALALEGAADETALKRIDNDLEALAAGGATGSTGSAYDMPYYSFGKPLRRLTKE